MIAPTIRGLWSLTLLVAVMLSAVTPAGGVAQTGSAEVVTVIGIVVDSVSGRPVAAARVSLGIDGPGVATNALGRFALPNVPVGMRTIVVSRLGYQDLDAVTQITDPMGGVQLRIAPDPVQLEGITSGGRSDDIRGQVIDAETGAPVPFAQISLSRDGVRKIGRRFRSTDTLGYFLLPDVSTGGYVLRVERPDYGVRLQQILHAGDGTPLVIMLSPDARRAAALKALLAELDSGLAAAPKSTKLEEAKIQTAVMPTLDQFLVFEGPLGWGFDSAHPTTKLDYGRNADHPPTLYVNRGTSENVTAGVYSTKEFYRIDFLECSYATGSPPRRARIMIAYTYAYIAERMANPALKDPLDPDRSLKRC
jgi:hypothetical protein